MYDFLTIGSATLDVFVETQDANIVSVTSLDKMTKFMSFPYGSKLDIDEFSFAVGGGALNAASNFSNLGFRTSTIVKLGSDFQSKTILRDIEKHGVDTSNIIKSNVEISGFSIILLSFQRDRTVLAHRGTNATIKESEINFEAFKSAKWLYLAPLSGKSAENLDKISDFARKHNVKMAINVGTTSIKKHKNTLGNTLKNANIVIMNLDEASLYTEISVRPDNTSDIFSNSIIHPDIIEMLKTLHSCEKQIVIITDGSNGVYAYDGEKFYQCSEFEAKVVSTLGAGDAFASTFVASFDKFSDIPKALKFASVNAASVVGSMGAHLGLLTFDEIEEKLRNAKDFKVNII